MLERSGARGRGIVLFALVISVVLAMGSGIAGAEETPGEGVRAIAEDTAFTAIAAEIGTPPQPVQASDGKFWFAYEMSLTNLFPFTLNVTSIKVRDAGSKRVVATFSGPDLDAAMRPIASASAEAAENPTMLAGEKSAVVWLDFAVATRGQIPRRLAHEVAMTPIDAPAGAPPSLDATVGRVVVNRRPSVVLGPPLVPGRWMVNDGCCENYTHHRRGYVAFNGDPAVAQRYAIDFYKVDNQERTWVGDPTELSTYLAYGKPVIAASDATVVASFDGLPDQQPPGPPPIPPIDDTVGNHVILRIKPGVFLLYAHLKPGSVRVKRGQQVDRGDRLGLVGNSGNSSTPHLHFQVLSTEHFFPSDSAPFRFGRFDLDGHLVVPGGTERIWDDNVGLQPTGEFPYETAADPGPRRREMPLDRDIITFG